MVRRIAQSAPPTNEAASMTASVRLGLPRSSARICTVAINAPSCCGAWPYMRANDEQNSPNTPSGSATMGPNSRNRPKQAVTVAPISAKLRSTGTRRRIGPPGSQMQVSSAARAASRSGAKARYSLRAMMTATDRPARMPSDRLIARALTTIGRRARSGALNRVTGRMTAYCRFPWKKSRNNVADSVSRTPPITSGRWWQDGASKTRAP